MVAALALCLSWLYLHLGALAAERQSVGVDSYSVCAYPPYWAIKPGMSRSQILGLLGTPIRTRINPKAAAWTPAQKKRLNDEDASLMASLGQFPNVGHDDPVLQRRFDRLMAVRDLEDRTLKETWYYPSIPGWHGSIELGFDSRGRVLGGNCGYG